MENKGMRSFNAVLKMFYDDELVVNVDGYYNIKVEEFDNFRNKILKNPTKYLSNRTYSLNQRLIIRDELWLMKCASSGSNKYHSKFIREWCTGCDVDKMYIHRKFSDRIKVKKDEMCGICIRDMEKGTYVIRLNCRHKFHRTCINSWLEVKKNCPCCRSNFS